MGLTLKTLRGGGNVGLYEELTVLSKESERKPYENVKKEILTLVEVIRQETEKDAKAGLFETEFVIDSEEYPTIDYIYKDLNCLSSLNHVLETLLDNTLDIKVIETEYFNIKIVVGWYRSLHIKIHDDLIDDKYKI